MIIEPKIRGFLCTTAHPEGCAAHVQRQIDYVKAQGPLPSGPKKVLIIGASTGYGLSSRIAAAFGSGAATLGIFFERSGSESRCATAGWYNSAAFERAAQAEGLYAQSINGDAFSHEIKQQCIETIRRDLGQVDLVVYSLASPRRNHPDTGEQFKSVLKPIGQSYESKTLNTTKDSVEQVQIEPATEEEIAHTVAVMGGEDWEMWLDALIAADVLAPGAQTVSYSYIGPEMTWPIYTKGTIGRAKEDLDRARNAIDLKLAALGGRAWVSVNKALVTQASSAIPVVPLYISLLYDVMRTAGTHEDTIEQMDRLLRTRLYAEDKGLDAAGRIRLDDWEMDEQVQQEVNKRWQQVNTENLNELSDYAEYQKSFLRLFGFGLDEVDYSLESDPSLAVPSLAE